MSVERKAVEACCRSRVRIVQTGIGLGPIVEAVHSAAPQTDIFLLVGFAGAIRSSSDPTPAIHRVIGEEDQTEWTPSLVLPDENPATLLTLTLPACTIESKADLANRYPEASLIDMEASAFAQKVQTYPDRQWGVVRAVSDGPEETLPDDIADWLTANGNTRIAGVLRSLASRRTGLGKLAHLAKSTRIASRHLAEATDRMLHHIEKGGS